MGRLLNALRRLEQRQMAVGAWTGASGAEAAPATAETAQFLNECGGSSRAAADRVLAELIDIGLAAQQATQTAEYRPAEEPVEIGAPRSGELENVVDETAQTGWTALPDGVAMPADAAESFGACEPFEPWEVAVETPPPNAPPDESSNDFAAQSADFSAAPCATDFATDWQNDLLPDSDTRCAQLAATIRQRWADALPAVLLIASVGDRPSPQWLATLATQLEKATGTSVPVREADDLTATDLLNFRRRYPLTLIGSSSTNTTLASLAAESDAAYLCVRLGSDRLGDIERTAAKILARGGLIAGLIAE